MLQKQGYDDNLEAIGVICNNQSAGSNPSLTRRIQQILSNEDKRFLIILHQKINSNTWKFLFQIVNSTCLRERSN